VDRHAARRHAGTEIADQHGLDPGAHPPSRPASSSFRCRSTASPLSRRTAWSIRTPT
jgi:hypothetical protein